MRVIVNELQSLKQRTGVGRYTAELLRSLRQFARPDQIATFPTGWMRRAAKLCFRYRPGSWQRSTRRSGAIAWLKRQLVQQARTGFQSLLESQFSRICANEQFDLYHEPQFPTLPAACPTIATIHDLSLLLHPQWHPPERVDQFQRQLPAALAQCTHFITDSDAVRRQVIMTLGVSPARVSAVPLGIGQDLRPMPAEEVKSRLARLQLPAQYLLYLGTLEPRKNLLLLLRSYCSLPMTLRERWPLLLVGGWGWNYQEIADFLHATGHSHNVRHLGYLANRDLVTLYNGARALLYPSHYEGFGLPPLEMLACGGAVLASTAPTLQENLGGHAHLLDANDLDGWRKAMLRLLTDDDWWQSLRRNSTHAARRFRWDHCATATWQVYQEVLQGPGRIAA